MKLLLVLFSLFIISTNLFAHEQEDRLRGVILERISQFITYNEAKDEFIICIYDNKDMNKEFQKLYNGRKYKNLPIKVKSIKSISKIMGCDILYIGNTNKKIIKQIVKQTQPYTLLVTDDINFLDENFMLALYVEGSKINFAINHKALIDANLKVNYRLLKVASKVLNPIKNEYEKK